MKTENKISLLSLFVACCALGLTVWQGMLSRNHNHISVMPHLTVYDDMESNGSGIFFKNIGLGPAIITHFLFEIDGKFIDAPSATELLRNRIPIPLRNHSYFVISQGKNQSIVSNSKPFLIIGTRDKLQPEEMIEFLRAVESVKIHIAYKSMYGDAHRVEYLVDYIPKAIY